MAAPHKRRADYRNQNFNPEEQTSEVGSTIAQKASEVATTVGKKADDATSALGEGMRSWASSIRESEEGKGEGWSPMETVADTLDSGGRYLQQQGLSGIGEDITNMIRRNPVPAILVALAVGYLAARATQS